MQDKQDFTLDSEMVSKRLIWLRDALGFKNKRQFALYMNWNMGNYSQLEYSRRSITITQLGEIMVNFDVKPEFLMTGNITALPINLRKIAVNQMDNDFFTLDD